MRRPWPALGHSAKGGGEERVGYFKALLHYSVFQTECGKWRFK